MGEAIYEIGVEDNGVPAGLSQDDLDQSIKTLEKMAKELSADVSGMIWRWTFQSIILIILIISITFRSFLIDCDPS